MEITGTQLIAAPRAEVWKALNDPDTLKRCLPGCESVERSGDDAFAIVITAAVGPLRPRFNGSLRLTEAVPPASCVMVFEGQGGAMGFGKGSASVELKEAAEGTELRYAAQAQVGGKLAQVGTRLIDSVAKKISDDFFKAFRKQFVADEPARGSETPPARAKADPVPQAAARPGSSAAGAAASPVPPSMPAARSAAPEAGTRVPGWWLAVAFALGAGAVLAGVLAAG